MPRGAAPACFICVEGGWTLRALRTAADGVPPLLVGARIWDRRSLWAGPEGVLLLRYPWGTGSCDGAQGPHQLIGAAFREMSDETGS